MKWLNWRIFISSLAILIVVATIFYSRYLANQIAQNEREKIEIWAEAHRFIANATPETDITFASLILADQPTIPVIETNERDSITNFLNIDSAKANKAFLEKQLNEFRTRKPIITYLHNDSSVYNKYYYGESLLLKEVIYYPYVQLFIVALFILLTLISVRTRNKAEKDKIWASMAKETAHQLGTPVSALHGWVEVLRDTNIDPNMLREIEKDVERLQLVSERFSKIGTTSTPENRNLHQTLAQVVAYVQKRAPAKVILELDNEDKDLEVPLVHPLFEWVIENLLRNALDALDGEGKIGIKTKTATDTVIIDILDTGKGMSAQQASKIFDAGFTSKKRGWGVGLTLSKRIIEAYHQGRLFVLTSELGKGTTIRIEIPLKEKLK